MEIITGATTGLAVSSFPLKTAFVAKDPGRDFWTWFLPGLLLPFMSMLILLCLPIKSLQEEKKPLTNYREHGRSFYSEINFKPSSRTERQN